MHAHYFLSAHKLSLAYFIANMAVIFTVNIRYVYLIDVVPYGSAVYELCRPWVSTLIKQSKDKVIFSHPVSVCFISASGFNTIEDYKDSIR